MSERKQKKGLQALLQKQQKKATKSKNTTSSKKEDEEPASSTAGTRQNPSDDVESPAAPKQDAPAAKANDGNEDSSDDEFNYAASVGNKIVEQQNDSSKEQDVVQADYMIKKDGGKDGGDSQANQKDKPKRNNASNITFGGRPKFSSKKNAVGIGGDDFVALDEIDDVGNKKESQNSNHRSAAEGGREFKNLSSTAVASRKFEEEKEKDKPAERPRFFGKAKIGGGGESKQTTGQNIQYDFGVKFAGQNKDKGIADGGKKSQDRKDEKDQGMEVRKDKRRINQDKGRFGAKDQGLDDQELEEGFEVVNDRNQKRRQHRVMARTRDEDGEQQ